jgi:hypothetical protein
MFMGVLDRDQLLSASRPSLQVEVLYRGRTQHGRLPLRYCHFASPIDVILSLIVPLADLDFAASDIRLMTDETRTPSCNYPTKVNIVSHPCFMSLLRPSSELRSAGSDEGISS